MDDSDPLWAGVGRLEVDEKEAERFESKGFGGPPECENSARPIWRDERGVAGLRIAHGDGAIIALADVHSLTNLGIGRQDNGIWLANCLREMAGKNSQAAIAFDEYHLGFPEQTSKWLAILRLIVADEWAWGLGQAVLAGLAALLVAGIRFGRPRDVRATRRRQEREFVESAGRLLYEHGADRLAFERLFRHYRDRLCGELGLARDAGIGALANALALRMGREPSELHKADQMLQAGSLGRREVLWMSEGMSRLIEKLEDGRSRRS